MTKVWANLPATVVLGGVAGLLPELFGESLWTPIFAIGLYWFVPVSKTDGGTHGPQEYLAALFITLLGAGFFMLLAYGGLSYLFEELLVISGDGVVPLKRVVGGVAASAAWWWSVRSRR